MAFAPGSKLGPYEILTAIGAGGMGEVYKAHDSRLRRDVAIKVLPEVVARDEDRLKRFEQEALATAALNHPNILVVFDVGRHDGTAFVVEELLEGRTIREVMEAEVLPVRKVIEYAIQVASGLAAAHAKGIVHRDLKPENLFVTADQRVKILDFGLAKIVDGPSGSGASTVLAAGTEPGLVLGTIGYMSPEQVRGIKVDHRSDVFSFGAILYELLTSRRAFAGDTAADTMTAILKEPVPDLTAGERAIPPAVARVVDRCLEKDPAARFQSASDLAFALQNAGSDSRSGSTLSSGLVAPVTGPPRSNVVRRSVAAAGFILLGAALAAGAWIWLTPAPESPAMLTLEIAAPSGYELTETIALSPDGARLAFTARDSGRRTQLWIRTLETGETKPLAGTDGARNPFWSPDNEQIGFFDGQRLRKINVSTGRVMILAEANGSRTAGAWNDEGVILFATEARQPIRRVRAAGQGQAEALPWAVGFRPHFLPGGRYFLFHGRSGPGGIEVGDLETGTATKLRNGRDGQYLSGYLLFIGGANNLTAQRFDLASRTVQGPALEVADVGFYPGSTGSNVAVAANGLVAFRRDSVRDYQLVWYSRDGKRQAEIAGDGHWMNPEFSPDDSRLAAQRDEHQGGAADIWIHEVPKGSSRAIAAQPGAELHPIWSADGLEVSYGRYARAASSPGDWVTSPLDGRPEKVLKSVLNVSGTWVSFAPAPATALGFGINDEGNRDIFVLPLTVSGKRAPLVSTKFNETQPALSPDGKWVAYVSDESGAGARTIFVQPFAGGARQTVSAEEGGVQPRWSRDGRELFYLAYGGALMAVPVEPAGATLRFGKPQNLFSTTSVTEAGVGTRANYAVTRDGQRFIVAQPRSGAARSDGSITVLINWMSALAKAKREPE